MRHDSSVIKCTEDLWYWWKFFQNISSHRQNDSEDEYLEDDLMSILKWVLMSSVCSRHMLTQFKVAHRLHFSNEKLSKTFPDLDPDSNACEWNKVYLLTPSGLGPDCPHVEPLVLRHTVLEHHLNPVPLQVILCIFSTYSQRIHWQVL